MHIRIATRKSPLALYQANTVADRLRAAHPQADVALVTMTTRGDQLLDSPLAKIGGKGLFIKELENGLFAGEVDIAVHSLKDVPVTLPEGLHCPVVLDREDPHDAFVSNRYADLDALPTGAIVGTSSLRRQCQLRAARPHLVVKDLRGNVNTRLAKLDAGEFDAIILAAAGLKRLGLGQRIRVRLAPEDSLPAIGQGVIAIECRREDAPVEAAIAALHDPESWARITAERAMNARLGGSCQAPIAGFAERTAAGLRLRGLVGYPDGTGLVRAEATAPVAEAATLGQRVAEALIAQGADRILAALQIPDDDAQSPGNGANG